MDRVTRWALALGCLLMGAFFVVFVGLLTFEEVYLSGRTSLSVQIALGALTAAVVGMTLKVAWDMLMDNDPGGSSDGSFGGYPGVGGDGGAGSGAGS